MNFRGKSFGSLDTNPEDSVWPKTRNELISTPVIYEDKVYIANGQDPSTAKGPATSTASTQLSVATSLPVEWYGTTTKSGAPFPPPPSKTGSSAIPTYSGFLHCLDAKTGEVYWTHDLFAAVWGSAMLIDGKLYIGDEDGDVLIMQEGKTKKVIAEMNMGSSVYSTAVPANGVLYITNRNQLYALAETGAAKTGRDSEGRSLNLPARNHEHGNFRLPAALARSLRRWNDQTPGRSGPRTKFSQDAAGSRSRFG